MGRGPVPAVPARGAGGEVRAVPVSPPCPQPLLSAAGDEPGRDAEAAPREHLGAGAPLPAREEKQEPVVVRPYPQVQMLAQHHPVPPGAPVTVTAPPAHLSPAVPLSFSDGLMKVTGAWGESAFE